MALKFTVDRPHPGSLQDPLNIRIEGWIRATGRRSGLAGIEIRVEGRVLGRTGLFFQRPDKAIEAGFSPETPVGFAVQLAAPELFGREKATFGCFATFAEGDPVLGAEVEVALIKRDYRSEPYGPLLSPDLSAVYHREDIYGSGPSSASANIDCLGLVHRYLGRAKRKILDVGCGVGAYGPPLIAAGHDWLGAEVKESDLAELEKKGLPRARVGGGALPFPDASFDDALCIEVLEHIEQPDAFIEEIRRVICSRLLVSVPNAELIPYLHQHSVVPWHLLEADHRNFFTRANLRQLLERHFARVEVLDYAPLPIRTWDGIQLNIHLFAVCDTAAPGL